MSGTEYTHIPKHLDDSPRFLFWPLDEALLLIIPLFLGLFANFFVTGLMSGVVLLLGIRKMKLVYGSRFLLPMCYWYLPHGLLRWKRMPPSHIREFIG